MEQTNNIWDLGASQYEKLCKEILFYQKTSDFFFESFAYNNCKYLCDLGSGSSGLIANKALKEIETIEMIYCVDSSRKMIEVLVKNNKHDKIIGLHASAESFASILPVKMDVILINSAFWLFNINKSLTQIFNALSDDGFFIFNFAEWDFEFENYQMPPKYYSIGHELERRNLDINESRGIKYKYKYEELEKLLKNNKFSIIKTETVDIEINKSDWLKLYSIPSLAKRSLPNLPLDLSLNILENAINNLNTNQFPPVKWIFFYTKKSKSNN